VQTLNHLQAEQHRYSRIRLWGSVGFIVAVLGIGRMLDYWSIDYLLWVLIALLISNWLAALLVPPANGATHHPGRGGLGRILRRGEIWVFLSASLLLQVAHGPYYTFYSVYLQQHGYAPGVTGALWALGVAAEIVMFTTARGFLSGLSLRNWLLIALALSMLRWWMIAELVDDWHWLVVAQLLHAATFGLAHLVSIQLLMQYFGSSHQGQGQALYTSFAFGIGSMLGSLYSGYFWDSLGPQTVFIMACLVSGFAWILAFLGLGRQKCRA
jgi:MFS transporter, PPP family, 3-phenylpropionic acid transporter